jgi:hypothetical protein
VLHKPREVTCVERAVPRQLAPNVGDDAALDLPLARPPVNIDVVRHQRILLRTDGQRRAHQPSLAKRVKVAAPKPTAKAGRSARELRLGKPPARNQNIENNRRVAAPETAPVDRAARRQYVAKGDAVCTAGRRNPARQGETRTRTSTAGSQEQQSPSESRFRPCWLTRGSCCKS